MVKQVSSDIPYFLLVTDEFVLGTPRGLEQSSRTIDILFDDLAKNYNLQTRLKLLSAALIRPDAGWATPLVGEELRQGVAGYLAAFTNDPAEVPSRRAYLLNNGLVRILVVNDAFREEILRVA